MSFNVIATKPFERKYKKLSKKYKSLKDDLAIIFEQISENPTLGIPLGKDCYKIRMAISSKGKGKSGGGRIITYVRITSENIFLLDIYDKSEQSTITDSKLQLLINLLAD